MIGYDQNGNMTKDLNKGISNIQYNSLNLDKIGCASEIKTENIVFVLYFARLALSLPQVVTFSDECPY